MARWRPEGGGRHVPARAALVLLLASSARAMYCGKDNCYELLGVKEDAKLKDIKKAYYNISLTYHPDKNPSKDAHDRFTKAANAYEILSDKDSRKKYDYALAHPEEFLYNRMQYYTMVYAPKTDLRLVLLATVAALSVLQYYGTKARYERALTYAQRTNRFKGRLKVLEQEWLDAQEAEARTKASSGKYGAKAAKRVGAAPGKAKKAVVPEHVREELKASIPLDLGCEPPDWWKTLGGQLVLLPRTVYRYTTFNARWTYLYRFKRIPFSDAPFADRAHVSQQLLLKMGVSQTYQDDLSESQIASLVQKEIWVAENFKAFVLDAQKLGLPRAIGGVPKPARVRSSTWRDGIYEYDGDD